MRATPGPDPPDPPRLTVSCPENQELTIDERIDVQATASGGRPRYRFSMRRAPAGIGIDESTGEITGEPRQTGTFDVTVTVRDADNRSASCGFRITVECPDITVSGLRDVTVAAGEAISLTTSASGGKAPYTYRKESGPSWVTVNGSSGAIGGSTDTPGTYTVTVGVEDDNDCPDTDGKRTFTITVACPPLSVASIADVEATVGRAISLAARATGGCPPITFAMSGAPSAISINRSTGRISGTPSSTSTSRATVTVRDNRGTTDETRFQLRVSSPLSIVSISDVVVTWQLDMTPIQVSVSGGRPPHVHSLESAPAGIDIDESTGLITGTPTQLGSAIVTVIVRDQDQRQDEEPFTMTVALPGDFNGDGRRDAADAALLNKKFGLRSSDEGFDRRMDLNGDGTINLADLVILTGYIERDASARRGDASGSGSGDSGSSGD